MYLELLFLVYFIYSNTYQDFKTKMNCCGRIRKLFSIMYIRTTFSCYWLRTYHDLFFKQRSAKFAAFVLSSKTFGKLSWRSSLFHNAKSYTQGERYV